MKKRISIFGFTCALVLLVVAWPAWASCLACFGATPTYCGGAGDDTYTSIPGEVVAGYDGDDTLRGSNFGSEKICGNQGDDYVSGLAGGDYLAGNGGFDFVDGGSGSDYCLTGEVYYNCP